MKVQFSDQVFSYTGPELRPHFLLERFGIQGSGLVAWQGPCDVKSEHLVDWEDRLAKDHIKAESMIHFLGEFFFSTVQSGVLFQRLFISIVREVLIESLACPLQKLIRQGDDLYWTAGVKRQKLSVSIVTASPVSVLFHAGINLDAKGAPVEAIGLYDLGIRNTDWVKTVLTRIESEMKSVEWACVKVRPVI
jgi:hypothetical protein